MEFERKHVKGFTIFMRAGRFFEIVCDPKMHEIFIIRQPKVLILADFGRS